MMADLAAFFAVGISTVSNGTVTDTMALNTVGKMIMAKKAAEQAVVRGNMISSVAFMAMLSKCMTDLFAI